MEKEDSPKGIGNPAETSWREIRLLIHIALNHLFIDFIKGKWQDPQVTQCFQSSVFFMTASAVSAVYR